MPKFNIAVDHTTDREDAISRLKNFSDRVREDAPVEVSDVEETWDDAGNLAFAFKALGMKIAGTMVTDQQKIQVSGQLPFAALPFRGQIEKQIETKIKEALA